MRSSTLLLLFFAPAIFNSYAAAKTIPERYIASYTTQCLEYWFYPNHTNPRLFNVGNAVKNEIGISNNYELAWNWSSFSYEKEYPVDYVDQLMLGIILDFIKEEAYYFAKELTNQIKARKIAQDIYDWLVYQCMQSTYLEQGIFSGYIGQDLYIKIYQSLQNEKPSSASSSPAQQYYPSSDCCVCMESFNEVTRVFLTPCGHDICVDCAERWFFTENKANCPLCRSKVDKKKLRASINQAVQNVVAYAPSAPPLY